ncbi:MAG: type II toxin-antitoxin system RelE/ParE family toxin [Paludibacter sp.]|nr:type II toxin-antitoxin system RelE/ParE family toxin [Paludibacter sp.]
MINLRWETNYWNMSSSIHRLSKTDIAKVYDYIEQMLFAPIAAKTFLKGIYACIANLEITIPQMT